MVVISGFEFTGFQVFLIVALFIVGPAGYWNQKRRIKAQRELSSYVQEAGGSGFNEDIKNYILQNKA